MELRALLREISEKDSVSGFEQELAELLKRRFASRVDEIRTDNLGNLIMLKKGRTGSPRVILCAHMDEIGLIVTKIEKGGFLRFTTLGGFDLRTLPGQAVTLYGTQALKGIIGFSPPHLQTSREQEKSPRMESLFIDTGLPEEEVRALISVGSVAALQREFIELMNRTCAGKAMDDRAGVAVLWQCAAELQKLAHDADVYLVATVQEEVGVRGAVVSTYGLSPDLGVAVDVCHGSFPGTMEHEVSELGKGPVITSGPNIHPQIAERLLSIAKDHRLPYQTDFSPGPTGTDARAIQVSIEGVPVGLLSIPLRYMHTSVELLDLDDLKLAGRLLAYFISGLDQKLVEELSCL